MGKTPLLEYAGNVISLVQYILIHVCYACVQTNAQLHLYEMGYHSMHAVLKLRFTVQGNQDLI